MTGPRQREPGGGATAATGTTGTGGDIRAIAILIAVGIALRLIIAYVLLPSGTGFGVDVGAFRYWADNLGQQGPFGFYDRGFFADYTPGYLYVLWLVGLVGRVAGGAGDLIKLPAIIADGAMAYLVWSMSRELGAGRRAALLGAALVLVNPVTWFDSAVWGQVDSVGTVVLLLAVRQLWRGRMISTTVLATVAAIVKPQFAILVPIAAVVIVRRYVVDRPNGEGPLRLVAIAAAGLGTAVALSLPFGLSIFDLARRVITTAAQYAFLTVNAYNPWALLSLDGNGLASNGTWVRDVAGKPGEAFYAFGQVPAILVGAGLLVATIVGLLTIVWRRQDRRTILVVVAVMAIAFFVVPTRVHERYLFPFFALGAILAATSLRWRIAYLVIAVASFGNLYAILTLPFYANPGIVDWLGLGGLLRSYPGVAGIAAAHLGVFAWSLTRLRATAVEEDEDEARRELIAEEVTEAIAGIEEPGAEAGSRAIRPGRMRSFGLSRMASTLSASTAGGWFRRLASPATRDRSAALAREGGGRFDRLDLWVLVVLVVAALVLRTYRLAEPYRMHFDEVYHARTATEFLQFWRYGEKHDIYEYTHPHLAKYAIAAGIVVAGGDSVTATSDLGVPVRDAAIEPRWDEPSAVGGRGGDRLLVVTEGELRSYDLASRALEATMPITGARSVTVSTGSHRVYVGTEDGTILAFGTTAVLDPLRSHAPSDATLPPPGVLARLGVPVERLFATSDGATVAAALSGDGLATVDAASGAVLARTTVPGLGGMADGGSGEALVADAGAVTDAKALAAELARVAGLNTTETESKLAAASAGTVVLAGRLDPAVRKAVDGAIQAGRLPGVSFAQRSRLAVTSASGVVFLDPASGSVTDSIALDGKARDLANVTGVGDPALYVAGGRSVWRVDLGSGSGSNASPTSPSLTKTVPMPGDASRIAYDTATQLVHVLGRTQDGTADTIYVIEPNGNAVFADARLPFAPTAWALDSSREYPASDREQLLAFAADGKSASVSVGSNAFGWRLPGVLFGVATIGVLYVLLRTLFRRRSVAVLGGLFALADGMMFVQSRIAMNDVYVGFFVLAAFALFAALWTGRLRGWVAFVLGMPTVGLLLGLGLASKWVALYALGGIGILILARSALGRLLLVIGLAAITAVLGYMGIAVAQGATSGGNLFFLLLMIGITLAAVVVSVIHPVAWSLEEVRFSVYGPGALGIAGALASFALGLGNVALSASLGLVALAVLMLVIFRVGARFGMGPLAPPPPPDDPSRLVEPPAPPPEGWLRLGSGWGLPAAWMVVSLFAVPLVVYVLSYLPWVALGNRLTASFPAGNTGQTLLDLTKAMYDYHNGLRATHAASSPWWGWPLDLKPVWFFQESFAGGTSAAIYDTGTLAIWWLGIPAMAFACWQAFKRRSLGLALLCIGFLVMWLPWVRIDRATFQYHYYAALIFLIPALGYFVAEVWHGPSRRTWLLARVGAAVAVMGPALLWLVRLPLCSFVRVDAVYANSPACQASVGQLVVTQRVAAIVVVLLATGLIVLWQLAMLERDGRETRASGPANGRPNGRADAVGSAGGGRADAVGSAGGRQIVPPGRRLAIVGVAVALGALALLATGLLPDGTPVLQVDGLRPELIALVALVPLGLCAYVIITATDHRRFALGAVWAAALVFVLFYPNISALPLPSQVFNAYQGILPTWLYVFQFPVNTDPVVTVKLLDWWPAILFGAVLVTSAVVAYSAWSWRIALAERAAERGGEGAGGQGGGPENAPAGGAA